MSEENKLTSKQAYEVMIHLLMKYYNDSGGKNDIVDILSGGEYKQNRDVPIDMYFKYTWDEIVEEVLKGKPPKRNG